jgi:hypothetical protein
MRSGEPPMTAKKYVVFVDQSRVIEPELFYVFGTAKPAGAAGYSELDLA